MVVVLKRRGWREEIEGEGGSRERVKEKKLFNSDIIWRRDGVRMLRGVMLRRD